MLHPAIVPAADKTFEFSGETTAIGLLSDGQQSLSWFKAVRVPQAKILTLL